MNNYLAELENNIIHAPLETLPILLGELERLKGHILVRIATSQSSVNQTSSTCEALLTLLQVAKRLSIPVSRAYELARQHKLPAVKIGKYVRVPLNKLAEYERTLPRA